MKRGKERVYIKEKVIYNEGIYTTFVLQAL